MSRSWAKGSTTQWRKVRARILADNQRTNQGRCTLHIPGVCTGQADQVHHVLGREVSGDDPAYLAAVCRACNLKAGQPGRRTKPKRVSKW
jgi:5-methylcytosine-specific restriction endonuclease McrA